MRTSGIGDLLAYKPFNHLAPHIQNFLFSYGSSGIHFLLLMPGAQQEFPLME